MPQLGRQAYRWGLKGFGMITAVMVYVVYMCSFFCLTLFTFVDKIALYLLLGYLFNLLGWGKIIKLIEYPSYPSLRDND